MQLAVSLWRLVQEDRLVRWATYALVVLIWFALAWADVRLLLIGIPLIAAALWWLRRQRERRGWLTEPEIDVDLL